MTVSRRDFLKSAGTAAVTTAAAPAVVGGTAAAAQAPGAGAPAARTYRFFTPDEAAFVEAAMARLIPADAQWAGALEADVPVYLDRELAGAWGAGARFYASGPWRQGTPSQGYQLPHTPAEFFRKAIRGVNALLRAENRDFTRMSAADQDAFLQGLEKGSADLDGIPSEVFFDNLLASTVEGFFADPAYGGNRDMVSWRMIGFPGAHAAYHDLVERHGVVVRRAPVSFAANAGGHMHRVNAPSTVPTAPTAREPAVARPGTGAAPHGHGAQPVDHGRGGRPADHGRGGRPADHGRGGR
jgi:gluconate 2-dehydrogenase gamma chain